MALDRASAQRDDPTWVARARQHPGARLLAAGRDGVLLEGAALARCALPEDAGEEPILLGLDGDAPLFAADLDARPELAGGRAPVSLREAGAVLGRAEAGLAAYLMALLNWHRRHRHCANCGAPTAVVQAGYARRCAACGAQHFPRTDPVVIMSVEHDGRLLLGRHAGWPARQYSTLAGFVSPGESLEEAVREVREESGIVCRDPSFVTSQPWPFPSSLMLGFHARADGGDPAVADGELEDVRWFDLATLRAASATGQSATLRLPPPISIARHLIDRWLAGGSGHGG